MKHERHLIMKYDVPEALKGIQLYSMSWPEYELFNDGLRDLDDLAS